MYLVVITFLHFLLSGWQSILAYRLIKYVYANSDITPLLLSFAKHRQLILVAAILVLLSCAVDGCIALNRLYDLLYGG